MKQMIKWSSHRNLHLRRLASEGTRPKLPWAPPLRGFMVDPSPSIPILENLKNDDSHCHLLTFSAFDDAHAQRQLLLSIRRSLPQR